MSYELVFTESAVELIEEKYDAQEIVATLRAELDQDIFEDGERDWSHCFIHACPRAGGPEHAVWVCQPAREGNVVVVDTGEMRQVMENGVPVVLDKGQFAGLKVMLPYADTDMSEGFVTYRLTRARLQ